MTDALVSTAWVVDRLGKPGVRVIDASSEPELHDEWHVPGAVALDWHRDLVAEEDESSGMVPDPERFAALARRFGLQPDDTLVFYGDQGGRHATRALWMFQYYRHPGKLHLMDGGREQWQREGRPTSTERTAVEPSGYPVPSGRRPELRITVDEILRSLREGSAAVLDVRTREEYEGTDVRAARGGHIPGAQHIYWEEALTPEGTFRSMAELSRLYADVPSEGPVAVHCQLGVRAAHTWFVLHHILDRANARNYDGSWQEWGNREDTPIES